MRPADKALGGACHAGAVPVPSPAHLGFELALLTSGDIILYSIMAEKTTPGGRARRTTFAMSYAMK